LKVAIIVEIFYFMNKPFSIRMLKFLQKININNFKPSELNYLI